MEYIGNVGIRNKLKTGGNLDYIAFIMTPWHAFAFEAALKRVEHDSHTKLKGIIVIKPHIKTGYMLDDSRFGHLNCTCYYFRDDETITDRLISEARGVAYYIRMQKSNKKPFYFFKPNGFRYPILALLNKALNNQKRVVAVSLDEGLGIYLNDGKGWFKNTLRDQKSVKGKVLACIKYAEICLLNTKKLKTNGMYINAELLIGSSDGCLVNEKMPEYFRDAVQDYVAKRGVNSDQDYQNSVVINTQPMENILSGSPNELDGILKDVIKILKSCEVRVIIKPHPREHEIQKYEKWGAVVYNNQNESQETLLAASNRKPLCVISFFSTTLVSTNLLFGIKTISLCKLMNNAEGLNEHAKDVISKFEGMFNRFVECVDDLEDIKPILLKELSNDEI